MRIFNYVSAVLVAMVLVGCDGDARPFEEAVEVRTENLTFNRCCAAGNIR